MHRWLIARLLSCAPLRRPSSLPISRSRYSLPVTERIPERVVHARGAGAHGVFRLKKSLAEYTTASVLTDTSKETPIFVRFSTVAGSRGSADTVRDVRGFAIKFYSDQGIWDMVGNNIPIFFVQDRLVANLPRLFPFFRFQIPF